MTSMTLTAESYADLRPFEMMAKRFGIGVEFTGEKTSALEGFRALAEESCAAAKKAGLVPDDVNAAIKEVRRRHRKCA